MYIIHLYIYIYIKHRIIAAVYNIMNTSQLRYAFALHVISWKSSCKII